jgi:hypothetical protein
LEELGEEIVNNPSAAAAFALAQSDEESDWVGGVIWIGQQK